VDAFHESIHALHFSVVTLGSKEGTVAKTRATVGGFGPGGRPGWPSRTTDAAERIAWAAMLLYQNQFNLTPIEEQLRARMSSQTVKFYWDRAWIALDKNLFNADFDAGRGTLTNADYERVFTVLSYRLSCRWIREELVRAYRVPKQCLACPATLPGFLR
jgi:hypothetical protein